MIKMTKGVIGAISGVSAAVIGGTTVAANVLIKDNTSTASKSNPLNRGKNFHYYSLVNKISTNEKLSKLVSWVKKDNVIAFVIDEHKFVNNMKSILLDTFKAIPTFSKNYLNYKIDCHYKVKNTKSILVDLVWYEPDSKVRFYDQFELLLQTA